MLRSDKSVFSLAKLLLQHVFPDQEREYVELSAKQTMEHRQPRDPLPPFLRNRPKPIVSACLLSIEKAKAVDVSTIVEEDSATGSYRVNSKNGTYIVKIENGTCTCPYYTLRQIPCKHMFCVFQNFGWTWNDLPSSCTECPHMVLDTCTETPVDMHNDPQDILPVTSATIPPYQAAGSKLLAMQKQLRDELAKCTAAVFMIDDLTVLETVQEKVHTIHSELLSAASTSPTANLTVMKQLMKEEVAEVKKKSTSITRANQITKKYRQMKRTRNGDCPIPTKIARPIQKDDPLREATHASVGRPKGKKKSSNSISGIIKEYFTEY